MVKTYSLLIGKREEKYFLRRPKRGFDTIKRDFSE
jgi:hypothetical protein